MNELLRHGGSLSGHESNCAFLNTGGTAFANVSSVSGFDFADDSRGLALVDWDADGDLDVWISNRTGPRIRFMRNESAHENHFVAFRLVGQTCNRDAIGARIEIEQGDSQPIRLIRSLRAGEGFLSQSSKWIIVGLGRGDRLSRATVYWPDGSVQQFDGLDVDQHYRIVQGQSKVETWQRPSMEQRTTDGRPLRPIEMDTGVVRLTHPVPLPRLTVNRSSAEPRDILDEAENPLLISLWATWCGPCLEELTLLTQRSEDLRRASLKVVAVNVDDVAKDSSTSTEDARTVLQRIDFPFPAYQGDAELLERLRVAVQVPFSNAVEFGVPLSLLVDSRRRLAVIYRGRIDIDKLLVDALQTTWPAERRIAAVLPWTGRWNTQPPPTSLLKIPREMLDRGFTDDALDYVRRNEHALRAENDFGKLQVWLGDQLIAQGRPIDGIQQIERLLQSEPANVIALNNLAWQLATHPESSVRDAAKAVRLAEQATRLTQARDAGVLDTLAASYAEAGRFEDAVKAATRAVDLLASSADAATLQRIQRRLELYHKQQRYHRATP